MARREDGRFIVSFSELKTWSDCPHKWRAYYELGARDVPELNPPSQYLAWGSSFHDGLEQHLLGNDHEWPRRWKEEIKEVKESKQAELEDDFKEAVEAHSVDLIHRMPDYLQQEYGEGWEVLGTEVQFEIHLDDIAAVLGLNNSADVWVKGFIDLVMRDPKGKIWCLDWKTSFKGWSWWKRRDEDTPKQLQLYKACLLAGMHRAGANVNLRKESRSIGTEYVVIRPRTDEKAFERIAAPSGPKALERTFKWAQRCSRGMLMGIQMQNERACRFCPLAGNDEWCDKPQATRADHWVG